MEESNILLIYIIRLNLGFIALLSIFWLSRRLSSMVAAARSLKSFREALPWALFAAIVLFGSFFRLFIARANILDVGGIQYSRLLEGYPGHFSIAELYGPLYFLFGQTLENAILLNRIIGSLTIWAFGHLFYRLTGSPSGAIFGALAVAVFPLHILMSAGALCSTPFVFFSILLAGCLLSLAKKHNLLSFSLAFQISIFMSQIRGESVFFLFFSLPILIYAWFRNRKNARYHAIGSASLAMLLITFPGFVTAYHSNLGNVISTLIDSILINSRSLFDDLGISRFVEINILNFALIPAIYPLSFLPAFFLIKMWHRLILFAVALAAITIQILIPKAPDPHNVYDALKYFLSFHFLYWFGAAWTMFWVHKHNSVVMRMAARLTALFLLSLPFIYFRLFQLEFAGIEEHRFIRDFIATQPASCNYLYADHKHLMHSDTHTYEEGKQFVSIFRGIDRKDFFRRMIPTSDIIDGKPDAVNLLNKWLGGGYCVYFYYGSICYKTYGKIYSDCSEIGSLYRLKPAHLTRLTSARHYKLVDATDVPSEDERTEIGFSKLT